MQSKGRASYLAAVLAAGTLWGFMGVFRRVLGQAGVDSAGVIVLRCGTAAVLFFLTLLLRNPKALKIRLKDLWCFLGTGLCSMMFFTYCYFRAIELMSLSAAAILLYTAPVFVVLLSAVLFGERLNRQKLLAMVLAFFGCCFVCGAGGEMHISPVGLLFGLGAGIGYALYSIFAKFALERGYDNYTINLYTHGTAAMGAALLWGAGQPLTVVVSSPWMLIFTIALGFLTCYLPYLLYTYSLTGLEAGQASIYANAEPVVATLVGVILYREPMTLGNFAGIVLVLGAVLLLGYTKKAKRTA